MSESQSPDGFYTVSDVAKLCGLKSYRIYDIAQKLGIKGIIFMATIPHSSKYKTVKLKHYCAEDVDKIKAYCFSFMKKKGIYAAKRQEKQRQREIPRENYAGFFNSAQVAQKCGIHQSDVYKIAKYLEIEAHMFFVFKLNNIMINRQIKHYSASDVDKIKEYIDKARGKRGKKEMIILAAPPPDFLLKKAVKMLKSGELEFGGMVEIIQKMDVSASIARQIEQSLIKFPRSKNCDHADAQASQEFPQ